MIFHKFTLYVHIPKLETMAIIFQLLKYQRKNVGVSYLKLIMYLLIDTIIIYIVLFQYFMLLFIINTPILFYDLMSYINIPYFFH